MYARVLPLTLLLAYWSRQAGDRVLNEYWKPLLILVLLALPDRSLLFSILAPVFAYTGWTDISLPTAVVGTALSDWAGMGVELKGVDIITDAAIVTVWEPCDGSLTMDFMLKLAVVLIVAVSLPRKQWMTTILTAVSVAFLINCLRIALLVYFADSRQAELYHYYHEGAGSQIFALSPIALLMVFAYFQIPSDEESSAKAGL